MVENPQLELGGTGDSWKDTEKLYDNDPETAKNAPAPFSEAGDQPMAMESEVP